LEDLRGKEPGRTRNGWEENITMDLKETGCDGVNWIQMAQNGFIQNSATKCGEFLDKLSDCQLPKDCAP
jgi:hypothetical protein